MMEDHQTLIRAVQKRRSGGRSQQDLRPGGSLLQRCIHLAGPDFTEKFPLASSPKGEQRNCAPLAG
jgi:hypothetical protein